jgi:hypothetical protein
MWGIQSHHRGIGEDFIISILLFNNQSKRRIKMKPRLEIDIPGREYKMVRMDKSIYEAMKKHLDEKSTYCSATRFVGDLVESELILESQKTHQSKEAPS